MLKQCLSKRKVTLKMYQSYKKYHYKNQDRKSINESCQENTSTTKDATGTRTDEIMDENKIIRQLLRGHLDKKYPKDHRIVRIFLSSTFSDYKIERDALFERVYPLLQDHCRRKEYEFQVVDMRWGVRDEATIDHLTSDLCLKELSDCKDLSTGPYFVALLSQRYGYRPLERTITKDEFEHLISKRKPAEMELLQKWYKLDENAVPEVYVLQPITLHIPHYANKQEGKNEWYQESDRLKEILFSAAKETLPNVAHRYEMSVTELEIEDGLFATDCRPRDCFVFYRNIQDIGSCKLSKRYRDEDPSGSSFTATSKMLTALKAKLKHEVAANGNGGNTKSYFVSFKDIKQSKESKVQTEGLNKYIDSFCSDFEKLIKNSIDQATANVDTSVLREDIYNEALQHIRFCKTRCDSFYGREDLLKKTEDQIKTGKELPYIIYGNSGVGKTSLTAQIAKNINRWLGGKCVVIMRFIGTTVESSTIRELLISVIRQIRQAYDPTCKLVTRRDVTDDVESRIIDKFKDSYIRTMKEVFYEALEMATAEEPLVLIMDSLDQLSTKDDPQLLEWCPDSLPPNVYFIVSTLPDTVDYQFGFLPKLRGIFEAKDSKRFLHVEMLDAKDTELVINGVLEANKRKLTPDQIQVVTAAFSNHKTPLFLKLCCEEALKWTSFQQTSASDLQTSVAAAIEYMVNKLEEKHGKALVQRTFAYITISRYGLSESELQSILSCDEEVLGAVYQYWTPPIRILPPLLFVRLKRDVGQYLVDRGADGTQVITWYHNQFKETIHHLLLFSSEEEIKFHRKIAQYFMDDMAWGEKRSYLTPQPLKIGDVWNMRKLNELPFHLAHADMFQQFTDYILMSLEWHIAKIKASGTESLIEDIKYGIKSMSEKHDTTQWDMMRSALEFYREDVLLKEDLDPIPSEILGRLPKGFERFENYREQCVRYGGKKLLPINTCLPGPESELKRSLRLSSDTKDLCLTADGGNLIVGCHDKKLHFLNLKTWSHNQIKLEGIPNKLLLCCSEKFCVALGYNVKKNTTDTIEICNIKEQSVLVALTSDNCTDICSVFEENTHIAALTRDSIKLFKVETGKQAADISHSLLKHGKKISGACNIVCVLKQGAIEVFDVMNDRNQPLSHRWTIPLKPSGFPFQTPMINIACSPSAECIMVSDMCFTLFYHVSTGETKYEFPPSMVYRPGFFITDSAYVYSDYPSLDAVNLDTKDMENVFQQFEPIRQVVASRDGNLIATMDENNCIRLWENKLKLSKNSSQHLLEDIREILVLPEKARYILIHTHAQCPVSSKLYIYDIQKQVVARKVQLLATIDGLRVTSATALLACSDQMQLILINTDNMSLEKQYPISFGSSFFHVLPMKTVVMGLTKNRKGFIIYNTETDSSSVVEILPVQHQAELGHNFMTDNEARVAAVPVQGGDLLVVDIHAKYIQQEITLDENMPLEKYHITKDGQYLSVLCGQNRKFICDVWNLRQGNKIHTINLDSLLSFHFLDDNGFYLYAGLKYKTKTYDLMSGEPTLVKNQQALQILFPKQTHSDTRYCLLVSYDRYHLCDVSTLEDVAKFQCTYESRPFSNTILLDNGTIVGTRSKFWNDSEENVCILQLYDDAVTKTEHLQVLDAGCCHE